MAFRPRVVVISTVETASTHLRVAVHVVVLYEPCEKG